MLLFDLFFSPFWFAEPQWRYAKQLSAKNGSLLRFRLASEILLLLVTLQVRRAKKLWTRTRNRRLDLEKYAKV